MAFIYAKERGYMKKNAFWFLFALLVFAIVSPAFCQEKSEVDQSIEPPTIYNLVVDGQKFELQKGKLTELPIEAKNPKVTLTVEPFKEFPYAGIYLKYPEKFTFEADLADENVKMWNLSGSSGILMIQKYSLEMDHQTMAHLLQPRYGEENARIEDCNMIFDGQKVPGTKVVATFGGTSISQEVYSFKVSDGSVLLILQDSIDPDGKPTKEGTDLKETIGKSFKLTGK